MSLRNQRESAEASVPQLVRSLVTILLTLVTSSLTTGCQTSGGEARVASIIHCKAASVKKISLLPMGNRDSLVAKPITFSDQQTIDRICKALNAATRFYPNHPAASWRVQVKLEFAENEVQFWVLNDDDSENGTQIEIESNVTFGNNYGTYRTDELGPLLKELALASTREQSKEDKKDK